MTTIKIINASKATDIHVLSLVQKVMKGGRISSGQGGPSYCAATVFHGGVSVFADRTKTMDTFRVTDTHP